MKFQLTIETERPDLALGPRQLVTIMRQVIAHLRKEAEIELLTIERHIRDADGGTIGKWTWSTGLREM